MKNRIANSFPKNHVDFVEVVRSRDYYNSFPWTRNFDVLLVKDRPTSGMRPSSRFYHLSYSLHKESTILLKAVHGYITTESSIPRVVTYPHSLLENERAIHAFFNLLQQKIDEGYIYIPLCLGKPQWVELEQGSEDIPAPQNELEDLIF